MNRLIALAAGLAMVGSMVSTPTFANTDSGAYGKHAIDCLGMLFGDPQVHTGHCGPFNQPPFWFPTGGSGAVCNVVGEISPADLGYRPGRGVGDGYLEAKRSTTCNCASISPLPSQSPDWTSVWGLERRTLVATPIPSCGPT